MGERIRTEAREQEPVQKRKVFIDLGYGYKPMLSSNPKYFGPEDIYIGLDLDEHQLGSDLAKSRLQKTKNKNILLTADMGAMPLADNSADEMLMANVVGEPILQEEVAEKQDPYRFKTAQEFSDIFGEAHRVLKDDGKFFIVETYTPNRFSEDGVDIVNILKQKGFIIDRIVRPSDEDYQSEMNKFSWSPGFFSTKREPPYILYASKTPKQ